MADFLKYIHKDPNITTIGEFLDQRTRLVTGMTAVELLLFRDNIEILYASLNDFHRQQHKSTIEDVQETTINSNIFFRDSTEILARTLPLNTNVVLNIPKDNSRQELVFIYGQNQFIQSRPFTAYLSNYLANLVNDRTYVKAETIGQTGRNIDIQIINENVQVWVYSKVLQSIINISPFIRSCSTSKQEVGSFNITLNPVLDINDVVRSGSDTINFFQINNRFGEHPVERLNNVLQLNDIVFIRFEKLEIEGSTPSFFEFNVDPNNLPGQVWDMIGLIDSCSSPYVSEATDFSTTIAGRDLTKLLIEDASYFMPLRYIQGNKTRFFYGGDPNDDWFRRNILNGGYDYLFFYGFRNIRSTLGFTINHLSNLGVTTNNNLFQAYGERISRIYSVDRATEYVQDKNVNGIWQIIKLQLDPVVEERVISDPSFAYVDGNLIDQFNKVCQKPFVEFLPDTYGDIFSFSVRQPPFTQRAVESIVQGFFTFLNPEQGNEPTIVKTREDTLIVIEEKDLMSYELEWSNEFYSWYQLQPQNVFLGEDAYVTLSYIPIVYFEEYAQYFGNHRMIIADNYLPATTISGDRKTVNLGNFKRAMLSDLKYIIDINAYLPFTRQGTITLTNGDRRIKRGTFIKLEATGEIFYVDAVSHSVSFTNESVNRTTTVSVSRGMIEQYISGAPGFEEDGRIIERGGEPIFFSYFNIINTDLIISNLYQQTEDPVIVRGRSTENDQPVQTKEVRFNDSLNNALDPEVFDFFLRRKQLNIRRV